MFVVVFFKLSSKEGVTRTTRETTAVDEAQPEDGAQPVHHIWAPSSGWALSNIPRSAAHFLLLVQARSVPVPVLRIWADRQGTSWQSLILRQLVGKSNISRSIMPNWSFINLPICREIEFGPTYKLIAVSDRSSCFHFSTRKTLYLP